MVVALYSHSIICEIGEALPSGAESRLKIALISVSKTKCNTFAVGQAYQSINTEHAHVTLDLLRRQG